MPWHFLPTDASNPQIIDVTNEIIRDYWDDVDAATPSERPVDPWIPPAKNWSPAQERAELLSRQDSLDHASIRPSPDLPTCSPASYDVIHSAAAHLLDLGATRPVAVAPTVLARADDDQEEAPTMPAELAELADDPTTTNNTSPASDGIFQPGSAYLEFHATLRTHTFQAARSTFSSRCGTPDPAPVSESLLNSGPAPDVAEHDEPEPSRRDGTGISAVPTPGFVELTQQQEFELWKNWVDEIGPWVRRNNHFPGQGQSESQRQR